MEKWYTEDQLVDDGSVTATVSSRKLTEYFRPYQIVSTNMLYNGMTWSMAQYLQPMPLRQFMLTAPDHKTYVILHCTRIHTGLWNQMKLQSSNAIPLK